MADKITIPRGIDIETVGKDDFIHPIDGPQHGYYGFSPKSDEDREASTLAGVTRDLQGSSGTAKSDDKSGTAAVRGTK